MTLQSALSAAAGEFYETSGGPIEKDAVRFLNELNGLLPVEPTQNINVIKLDKLKTGIKESAIIPAFGPQTQEAFEKLRSLVLCKSFLPKANTSGDKQKFPPLISYDMNGNPVLNSTGREKLIHAFSALHQAVEADGEKAGLVVTEAGKHRHETRLRAAKMYVGMSNGGLGATTYTVQY